MLLFIFELVALVDTNHFPVMSHDYFLPISNVGGAGELDYFYKNCVVVSPIICP